MANGLGPSAAGLAPFGNNFRSIENVNETTITNLADEFLNADFANRDRPEEHRGPAYQARDKAEYFPDSQHFQSQVRMNPFLSQNNIAHQNTHAGHVQVEPAATNNLDTLLGLTRPNAFPTGTSERINFYPENTDTFCGGPENQPSSIFDNLPPPSSYSTQEMRPSDQPRPDTHQPPPQHAKPAEAFTVDFQGFELKKNKEELRELTHQQQKKQPMAFTLDFGPEDQPTANAKRPEAFAVGAASPKDGAGDPPAQAALNFQKRMQERQRLMEEKKRAKES